MAEHWPSLERPGWEATRDHLHLWTQMIGKTALALAPPVNHWWHVTLHMTPRGLATRPLPTGDDFLGIELDLVTHHLIARSSEGRSAQLPLEAGSVADFFSRYQELLGSFGMHPHIYPQPVECDVVIPFDKDTQLRPYDPEWAEAYFTALRGMARLLEVFRGEFIGKASPVHFFWGAFDLATTRFSGRRAPRHPGGVPNCPDHVMHEAYSHECSSAGFWPGGGGYPKAALYSYAYPEPHGFAEAPVLPEQAFYSDTLREFILPYDAVRESEAPEKAVLSFLQSTYAAAADNAHWDRDALERGVTSPTAETGEEPWPKPANISSSSSSIHPM